MTIEVHAIITDDDSHAVADTNVYAWFDALKHNYEDTKRSADEPLRINTATDVQLTYLRCLHKESIINLTSVYFSVSGKHVAIFPSGSLSEFPPETQTESDLLRRLSKPRNKD